MGGVAGWAPTRKLKDVIWGLNSLFSVRNCHVHSWQISILCLHVTQVFSLPVNSIGVVLMFAEIRSCLINFVVVFEYFLAI